MDEVLQGWPSVGRVRELVTVVLLSVTAVVTAWCGFQAAKWAGASSDAFSESFVTRVESASLESDANRQLTVQVQLFSDWLAADATGNSVVAEYLQGNFPEPLRSAWVSWVAGGGVAAGGTPFDVPEYVQADRVRAQELADRSSELFDRASELGAERDGYTFLTVVLATVLFFAALSARVRRDLYGWVLLGVGGVLFVSSVVALLVLPTLI